MFRTAEPACLYRVVEVVRGTDGRLQKLRAPLHPDLVRARQHAALAAAQGVATQIYIADQSGRVVQRLL